MSGRDVNKKPKFGFLSRLAAGKNKSKGRNDVSNKSTRSKRSTRSVKSTKSSKRDKSKSSIRSNRSSRSKSSKGSWRKKTKPQKRGKSSRSSKSSKSTSKRRSKSKRSDRSVTNSLRSEKSEKSTKSKSKKSTKSGKLATKDGHIALHCRGESYLVTNEVFVKHSTVIAQMKHNARIPRVVDVSQLENESVVEFVNFLYGKELKKEVSFFTLTEMLKLSRAFDVAALREKLEKILRSSMMGSPVLLAESLLVAGHVQLTIETERSLLGCAAANFSALLATQEFRNLTYEIFLSLMSRCDLNVKHEMDVVDAILFWLSNQKHAVKASGGLFSVIRYCLLNEAETKAIKERMVEMGFPRPVMDCARRATYSGHCRRICIKNEHLMPKKLVRCGIPDPELRAATPLLPLTEKVSYTGGGARPLKTTKKKFATKDGKDSSKSGKPQKIVTRFTGSRDVITQSAEKVESGSKEPINTTATTKSEKKTEATKSEKSEKSDRDKGIGSGKSDKSKGSKKDKKKKKKSKSKSQSRSDRKKSDKKKKK